MPSVTFTIPGNPVGKPRQTRSDKWKKRPCVLRYRDWADSCREQLAQEGGLPAGAVVTNVWAEFYIEPPKSWSKARKEEAIGELHEAKPDIDNLLKSVMDAVLKEDSTVSSVQGSKFWGATPETHVTLRYRKGKDA